MEDGGSRPDHPIADTPTCQAKPSLPGIAASIWAPASGQEDMEVEVGSQQPVGGHENAESRVDDPDVAMEEAQEEGMAEACADDAAMEVDAP